MYTFSKILRYFVINGMFAALGVYGCLYEDGMAHNGFLFMAWVTVALSLFVGITSIIIDTIVKFEGGIEKLTPDQQKSFQKFLDSKVLSVPWPIEFVTDVGILAIMVAHGHIVLGVFYLIQNMVFVQRDD